ncbi:hypothetical protein TIFTF001_041015 [Ficus carica]|uniref:Uncharacterized protein n=1 Tax=Ficus carica TaxID=3494 RepID=A0AA87Z0U1_FICCA|nr:hypothetical protein TIFTF001_041015 [Ficus carica]
MFVPHKIQRPEEELAFIIASMAAEGCEQHSTSEGTIWGYDCPGDSLTASVVITFRGSHRLPMGFTTSLS